MNPFKTLISLALLLSGVFVSLVLAIPVVQEKDNEPAAVKSATEVPLDQQFVPVDDMHHFMEYVCEPSYKGLKQALATEPADRKAWKPFKNHALVLAESSALVAARAPKDEAKAQEWKQIALEVHKSGTALYKSAGNYDEAKKQYGLMIDQCNQCHTAFAKGKHQLEK